MVCVVGFFSINIHIVFAEKHFDTKLTSSYTINTNGTTYVKQEFLIKNLTPTYYIQKYGIVIGSDKVSGVSITSNGNTVKPIINTKENETEVSIIFPNEVTGEGKARRLIINYQNPDIATVEGQVLEVAIPKFSSDAYSSHQIHLYTPVKFGEATRVNIKDYKTTKSGNNYHTAFSNVNSKGILAIYGSSQYYNLVLNYNLKNSYSQSAIAQITLPPDTRFQKVMYDSIKPLPDKIEYDKDNNWLATYTVKPQQKLSVEAIARVKLSLKPINNQITIKPLKEHLSNQQYWNIDHPLIKEESEDLKNAEEVYQYVIDKLEYATEIDEDGNERLGAVKSLKNPNDATCKEFSDLFITIARRKQIPSRLHVGYALSSNDKTKPMSYLQDALHAWPEYYDNQTNNWILVDPTWGDTTNGVDYFNQFDLNHITFAINGVSSDIPAPAGSYYIDDRQGDDVQVTVSEAFDEPKPDFQTKIVPFKLFDIINIPGLYSLKITNKIGVAFYNLPLKMTLDNKELNIAAEDQINNILPFQTESLPFSIYNNKGLVPHKTKLKILLKSADGQIYDEKEVSATSGPKWGVYLIRREVQISVASSLAVFTILSGSLLLFRRKKRNPLRR